MNAQTETAAPVDDVTTQEVDFAQAMAQAADTSTVERILHESLPGLPERIGPNGETVQSERAESDVVIYAPNFALRQKLGKDVKITDLLSREILDRAEAVITSKRQEFVQEIKNDIAAMQESLNQLNEAAWDAAALAVFMEQVLRVKARAGMAGYGLAGEIARRLYVFCDEDYRAKTDHLLVMRKHVEGVAVVLTKQIEGDGGAVGRALLSSLEQLTEKFRARFIP